MASNVNTIALCGNASRALTGREIGILSNRFFNNVSPGTIIITELKPIAQAVDIVMLAELTGK